MLINSGCITNIQLTNTTSGNFQDGDKSFGYFQRNTANFPFQDGIVMSTGKLAHVPGPNNHLSDDNTSNWQGDSDLNQFLNINYSTNATVIEFDFTPNANNIKFRYIFASEEYREYETSTCDYSDAFAFLIKPIGGQYENIAVIPGTTTPVKVTTVHPAIPGGCAAKNEQYFGSWNSSNAPINFNGQTAVLTAKAEVTPGTNYHIKLVIADEQNYRYDSAVFIEGSSFSIGVQLGPDLNGLCQGESFTLHPQGNGNLPLNYQWYKVQADGSKTLLAQGTNSNAYSGNQAGTYKVVLDYGGGCTASDLINVNYVNFDSLEILTLSSCQLDSNGNPIFDLPHFDTMLTQGHTNFTVAGYFLEKDDALNNINALASPENFTATPAHHSIWVRIVSTRGCVTALKINLAAAPQYHTPIKLATCPDTSGSLTFDLRQALQQLQIQTQAVNFYSSVTDALAEENPLMGDAYTISISELPKSVYGRLSSSLGCAGIFKIILDTLSAPKLDPNYQPPSFCADKTINLELQAGVIGAPETYQYLWNNGVTSAAITISEPGIYTVEISKRNIINGDTVYCTIENSLTVKASTKAKIGYQLIGCPNDYKVHVFVKGNGDYRFALDHPEGPFSTTTTYQVTTGKHHLYAKDLNGCGITIKEFHVVGFMKFFTPNDDGHNDYWHLTGQGLNVTTVDQIQIYDRYGKLLTILNALEEWNGQFHGRPLPATDYWFKITFKDGSSYTDHLSLIR